jgi:hypothetical protein
LNPDDFRKLVAAQLTTEQIALVMEMMDRDAKAHAEAEEARKVKGRERMAKWRLERHRNVTVTSPNVTEQLTGGDAHVEDKTSNLEIEPQVKKEQKETRDALFDQFWTAFPNKVGKPKARAAFPTAMRRAKSFDAIMAGLERYIANKPPDRAFLNPATFLNQERWTDEPATAPPVRAGPSRMNPTLLAAQNLMDKFDAVTPSEIEGHHPPPRLVAIGNR